MRLQLFLSALVAAVLAVSTATAGKYNPTLDIGDNAPRWEKLPGIDGEEHSLADLESKQAVVVVFTCNSCPYALDYEKRIKDFVARRCGADSKVALVAVNVNLIPEDSLEAMQERAKQEKFNFPYLHDATQKIGRDYGATYTPEFFVLDQDRKIAYMGAFDDNPDATKATVSHVERAVDALLAEKVPPVTETVAIGCTVRYKRVRRKAN